MSFGNRNGCLQAEDLQKYPESFFSPVIDCLNLPHGCFFDDAPENPGPDSFELPEAARLAALERRGRIGVFKSPRDLLGIAGFGPRELAELATRLSNLRRYGQRLRPVWGGPQAWDELFRLIQSAERYIHIQMYIIGGEVGRRLAAALAEKVRQGVKVRVLFTATGFVISGSPSGTGLVNRLSHLRSYLYNDRYVRKLIVAALRRDGVPLVDAAPIGRHWKRKSFRDQGVKNASAYERWARERGLPDPWIEEQRRIDRECSFGFSNVDHRKMVLIDGRRAFVGSMNIADSYMYTNQLSDDPKVNVRRWQWHDNAAILEGGCVATLNEQFAARWALSGGDFFDPQDAFYAPPAERMGPAAVTIVQTIPGMMTMPWRKNWGRFLLSMLGADRRPLVVGNNPIRARLMTLPRLARNDFYAEHCYPADGELLQAWAAESGRLSEFTLVVPLHYDTKLLGFECDRFYPEMISVGARLMGYRRAIMHSKVAVADGFYVSTGSYNLTLRSARADLELQFFIQCPRYGAEVRERIRRDLLECRPLRPGPIDRLRSRRSLPLLDAFFRYFFF